MTKLASQATVTKNGTLLRMMGKGEFEPGGIKRTPVEGPGGTILGFTEETVAPYYKGKAKLAAGEKLSDFNFEDATVVVTLNTDQKFIMRKAFTMDTPKWGDGGDIDVSVSCVEVEEL